MVYNQSQTIGRLSRVDRVCMVGTRGTANTWLQLGKALVCVMCAEMHLSLHCGGVHFREKVRCDANRILVLCTYMIGSLSCLLDINLAYFSGAATVPKYYIIRSYADEQVLL